MKVNLRSFKQKASRNAKQFRSFLTRLGNKNPKGLDSAAQKINVEVFQEIMIKKIKTG